MGKWSQARRRGSAPVAQIQPLDPLTLVISQPAAPLVLTWTGTPDPTSWDWELWEDDIGGTRVANNTVGGAFRTSNTAFTPPSSKFYRARMRSLRGGLLGPWTLSARGLWG